MVVESFHQATESVVHLGDVPMMCGECRVIGLIHFRVFFIGCDRLMRFMKANVQKKRFGFIATLAKPAKRFVGDEMRRVTFEFSYRFAIANEVVRISVARPSVILCRKPIVKAVVAWLG